jgi:HEPN domain-containing protein
MRIEATTLWIQAGYEMDVAKLLVANARQPAAAFHTQQAAEIALKAVHVERKAELYLRHNLAAIAARLEAPAKVRRAAAALLPLYLASRYGDAREDDTPPAEAITAQDATEALKNAQEVIGWREQALTKRS